MKSIKQTAKKAVAVLSSLTVLMSCGTAGMLTASAAGTSTTASATSNTSAFATKMNIYDKNGKDISSNPIIYLDNSDVAGGATSTTIKVQVGNDTSFCDDSIVYAVEATPKGQEKIQVSSTVISEDSCELNIAASVMENGKPKALKPGTTQISLTTESGEVYRTLTVVVYEPATDMKVYFQNKNNQLDLNDGNISNTCGVVTVANHKYQFFAEKVATTSTDVVEWLVYDGSYTGTGKGVPTTKAEITSDGLFTPKKNGVVTVVAKYKATETSPRDYSFGNKKINNQTQKVQTVPKYIQVVIVKENPAKAMQITNAPGALEAKETYQLDLEKIPTYTGSGYETGATDEIRWVSSNTKIATVDEKGLVTAISKGDVTITAYGENANVYAECNIRVLTKANAVTITPSPTSTRIGVGVQLVAKMDPVTADDEIIWTSSNENIAKVESTNVGEFKNSQTAVVTGVKKGQVIITARAKNSGVEAKCTVTVKDKIASDNLKLSITEDNVTNIVAPQSTINLYTNKDVVIDAVLTAADGSTPDDIIKWEVTGNDDAYVTIPSQTTKNITIHGVSEGVVTVKAYSEANPTTIYQTFKVQVLRGCDTVALIDNSTEKTCNSKSLNIGDSFSLSAKMTISGNYPYDHSDTVKSWTSSNPDIISVNNVGLVTALGNGSANITVTTASGKKAICAVKGFTTSQVIMGGVTPSSDGISLPTASIVMPRTGTATKSLSVQVKDQNGTNATNVNAIWTSSDETVATVSSTGLVTAHSLGQTTITVKSGTKSDSCILTVSAQISSATYEAINNVTYSPILTTYTPKPVIMFNGAELVEGTDYTLEYLNNTKVGAATIKVTGTGYFSGTINIPFRIVAKALTDPDVKISTIEKQQCTGTALTPEFTVTCEGVTVIPDVDYTVSWSNNIRVGKASVIITGKGNYTGRINQEFEIYCNHTDCTTLRVVKAATCKEDGEETVRCNACQTQFNRVINKGEHTYTDTVVAPTYSSNGYTLHECSVCGYSYKDTYTAALSRVSISAQCTVTLSASSFNYNGAVQKPTVTVKYGTKTLVRNTDYYLVYSNSNSKNVGTYTVSVVGKNGYKGRVDKTYKIVGVSATSVSLNKTSITLGKGETFTLSATIAPSNATNKTLTWSTSNSNVATVSSGKITAKAAGTATITVKTSNGKTATCKVTVKAAATSVTLNKTSITIGVGEKFQLISYVPSGTASYKRAFSSSNSSVVYTSGTGLLTGKKAGTATITVKTFNGKSVTCKVTVKAAATSVSLNKTSITIGLGETFQLKSYVPSGTASYKRGFSSSNNSVVYTSGAGLITGKKVGTATITVKTFNGKTATCKVTVKAAPTSISLNKTSITLKVGQTFQLTSYVPSGTASYKRAFASSNSSVVHTSGTGLLTAKKAGTATITVKTFNGKSVTCKVTVK